VVHSAGGDNDAAARTHIEQSCSYNEDEATVLFKPTLAREDQFRGTFDEALSYFVGGSTSEDGGFAFAPYSNVCWENEDTIISGDVALAMGNYFFTIAVRSDVKVEYTFGIEQMEDGELKIILLHSSLALSTLPEQTEPYMADRSRNRAPGTVFRSGTRIAARPYLGLRATSSARRP
jgi:hypothetical protein